MIKVLFICHGNICRSPMAEYVLKDMVEKRGIANQFYIFSAATSTEEIGNGVHYGTRRKLKEMGISCGGSQIMKNTIIFWAWMAGIFVICAVLREMIQKGKSTVFWIFQIAQEILQTLGIQGILMSLTMIFWKDVKLFWIP